ncbi:hypothetical protein UFOVP715_53 [uncultured Caudovirales phage]|jgi:hypothetical protein|uniref:Uncharacterized protein n=1 Tax=uncultured Caudovirales phage TaxID=2100421 RepID=A0A6J5NR85_9CAUD|nr:hypothetical protein UFOVP715_53 [uncultured Caudovirales phage]
MEAINFTFAGQTGTIMKNYDDVFVSWGGMAFQREAAKPQLQAAIDAAIAARRDANSQYARRVYMGSLSREVRKASY